jgi:hypothetical protein
MNMFAVKTKAKTPAEYLAEIPEPRKAQLKKLHALILKTVPSFKPYIQVGMIAYGKYHYLSKSGREGDWGVVALANQKNYISLYICALDMDMYLPEKYKKDLPKASIGRSCIRFKKIEDIDLKIIVKMLKESKVWLAKYEKEQAKKMVKKTAKK